MSHRTSTSHRNLGAESASGVRAARDRWSATLTGAEVAGRPAGLLAIPATDVASVPADPGEDDGAARRGSAEDAASGNNDPGRGRYPVPPRLRGRTGLRAAVLLGVLAVALGGWFWWQVAAGMPEAIPLSEVSPAGSPEPGADAGAAAPPSGGDPGGGTERIIVHVAGAVARPGVVELPAGSRLHEAIAAVGGSTGVSDPDRLNLAAVLEDGQKILVPARGDPGSAEPVPAETGGSAGAGTDGGGAAPGGGKIDLNTAGVEELGTLPRVGPVLAQRIVDWRKQHGRFQTVEELDAVDGVGPKMLEALLPRVRV
jgi:competence protein ComEA